MTDLPPEKEALSWVLSLAEGLSDFGSIQWIFRLMGED